MADQGDRLRRVADLLANIDALTALAEVAAVQVGSGLRSLRHLACTLPRGGIRLSRSVGHPLSQTIWS